MGKCTCTLIALYYSVYCCRKLMVVVAEEKFNYLRETFGDSSICLRHKGTWSLQVVGKGQKLYPRRYGAGCYKVRTPLQRLSKLFHQTVCVCI